MSIISDLNQGLGQTVSNCVGGYVSDATYYVGQSNRTLDVAYFLKHASEQVLVDMHKRIPEELKTRVNSARAREREAQEAYEQVVDAYPPPKGEP